MRFQSVNSVGRIFLLARLPSAPKMHTEARIDLGRSEKAALSSPSSVPSSSESELTSLRVATCSLARLCTRCAHCGRLDVP